MDEPSPTKERPRTQPSGGVTCTRWSRVRRLQDWSDEESWRWFYDTYSRLIFAVARSRGLKEDEAEEVVQETALHVCKSLKGFKADPVFGSFKAWLRKVVRGRIVDWQRRKQAENRLPRHHSRHTVSEEGRTPTVERVPDPGGGFDRRWDEEWQALAREEFKKRVDEKHYQIFDHHVFQGHAAGKVAKAFGVSQATVYVLRFRLMPVYRRVLGDLEAARPN